MNLPQSLVRVLRRFTGCRDVFRRVDFPPIHHIPNVGPNGQITIDCVIRATARPFGNNARTNQQAHGGAAGISPQRMGVVVVELDQYGLSLRWEPNEMSPQSLSGGFALSSLRQSPTESNKNPTNSA